MSLTKQEKEQLDKEFNELDQKLKSASVIQKIVEKLNEIDFMGFNDWLYDDSTQNFLGGTRVYGVTTEFMSLRIAVRISKYEGFYNYLVEQ